ncbi:DUF397 domain-containing protein [Streptomyces sp. ACA25]|uniref:DUF397 domain-containing protein n=1 Tax=Streptomyces sp. ACA25 TaxID=3022596 RepID=UPI002307305C|nr:DUF397 domain-containing protein [Streptomyces sp. ACA25]MDB1087246.1 DUF397 domain-containing protein [Streptomyces sp. ACA25]
MFTHVWQQSSYCGEGNACLQAAATAAEGGVRLRESAEPEVVLLSTSARLRALLAAVKDGCCP